jgi:predicted DCC family thiol-disulfide oxidoreductase YuxK
MKEMLGIADRLLVVYDGHCGLCNGWVRWLLRHDRRDRLRFAASVSPAVAQLLARHVNPPESNGTPDTVLVFSNPLQINEELWIRFAGVLVSLRELPQPWPTVAVVLGWIPDFLANPAYKLIARWRYCIWGRLESCPLPAPENRARFLSLAGANCTDTAGAPQAEEDNCNVQAEEKARECMKPIQFHLANAMHPIPALGVPQQNAKNK